MAENSIPISQEILKGFDSKWLTFLIHIDRVGKDLLRLEFAVEDLKKSYLDLTESLKQDFVKE